MLTRSDWISDRTVGIVNSGCSAFFSSAGGAASLRPNSDRSRSVVVACSVEDEESSGVQRSRGACAISRFWRSATVIASLTRSRSTIWPALVFALCPCADGSSRTDHDAVLHFGNPGCRPGDPFGLFTLDPGPDGALQNHFTALGFDHDAIGIDFGVAPERVLDLPFDFGGLGSRLEVGAFS